VADLVNDKHADKICRDRYRFLQTEIRQQGLDLVQLARSTTELSQSIDGRRFLKPSAFAPTGVALGCPLPDPSVTERLWQLAGSVDAQIQELVEQPGPTLAYVPPDHYHITLVNRTHFELSQTITSMGQAEKAAVRDLLVQGNWGRIEVRFSGLILTHWGRLIVPGFPRVDSLYRLRDAIAETVPELQTNIPNTAHVKLGHLLAPLRGEKLKMLLESIEKLGGQMDLRLAFDDVYTPAGRIELRQGR